MVLARSPMQLMISAVALCGLTVAAAVWLAVAQPWLGMDIRSDASQGVLEVRHVEARGPTAHLAPFITAPSTLVAVGGLGVTADDAVDEPDVLPSYADLTAFYGRQAALAEVLRSGPVELALRDADGTTRAVIVHPAPSRPLSDLPLEFWIQIIVGTGGFLISAWVWVLRRHDWGARMFGLTGLSMLGFTLAAAVYSTRELALDGPTFRILSAVNQIGALSFGGAMIALFLSYPRPLVAPRTLLILPVVIGAWLVAGLMQHLPGPAWGTHLPTAAEMLLIVCAIAAQWWATRRHPRERAALRWLGLSVILGAGAFVVMTTAPILLGDLPAVPQAYAFGFFLLIHAGLALGLRRYRLFELGEWAFRIMFYTIGLLILLAVDALLIMVLQLDHGLSLGLSLVAVGFGYLPLRDLLWRRMVSRGRMRDHDLFRAVVDVAFTAGAQERATRWRDLLVRLFDPLELHPADEPGADGPQVGQDGLELALPATADSPAVVLRYPWGGRGLFSPVHLQLAGHLVTLMRHAEAGREAYERGVVEERLRIAKDLHDDVGARLLSGLHKPDVGQARSAIRDALADIRVIARGLSGDRLPLARVIADLRHETGDRLEAAGIDLQWPLGMAEDAGLLLDYQAYRSLMSAHREIISNAIRHSGATTVHVTCQWEGDRLTMSMEDNGAGLPESPDPGYGLTNIVRRMEGLGGSARFQRLSTGLRVELAVPLRPIHTGTLAEAMAE